MRPAKTQISLGIHPVWSVFAVRMRKLWALKYLLSARWRLWSHWADAQAIHPGWSESSLGAHVILLVLSCSCSCVSGYLTRAQPRPLRQGEVFIQIFCFPIFYIHISTSISAQNREKSASLGRLFLPKLPPRLSSAWRCLGFCSDPEHFCNASNRAQSRGRFVRNNLPKLNDFSLFCPEGEV